MAETSGPAANVEQEVKQVTKDADEQAVSQHDKLVSEIEKKVHEVAPAAEGKGQGEDETTSTGESHEASLNCQRTTSTSLTLLQSVPRVQDEIHDAAPEADVSAVQAHTLLVSEIEKVVDKDASKPVHEIVDKVTVEEPAELKDVK
ncbi:hypothetical protein OIV83_005811 [Microbotryomycetes sp. JL201]|nr:hypothetical protein OIV83_005811 [Microbotryomycetes sp. JL201]